MTTLRHEYKSENSLCVPGKKSRRARTPEANPFIRNYSKKSKSVDDDEKRNTNRKPPKLFNSTSEASILKLIIVPPLDMTSVRSRFLNRRPITICSKNDSLVNKKPSVFPKTCVFSGYLDVKTHQHWRRRYFALNSVFLLCAATEHSPKLERVIPLVHTHNIHNIQHTPYIHTINIHRKVLISPDQQNPQI